MRKSKSSAILKRCIEGWLVHQRALGRGYCEPQWVLGNLQRFLLEIGIADLNVATFERWCHAARHLSTSTRRGRQLIVRKFCLFRRRTEPDCFVPDPLYFVRLTPYRPPTIIEPPQVARMLLAADELSPVSNSPLLPAVARLAVVILFTAGLRRGELVRLRLADVDAQSGLMRITASKFHKSRLVPLSPDAAAVLRSYLRLRLAEPFDARPSAPLLCSGEKGGRGYSNGGLSQLVRRLIIKADVHDSQGRRPRVHDLRHSFAVQALLRWYREGADVQVHLPRLAMYMGHVSIVSTAHYLHFVPAMQELASGRFQKAFGSVIEGTVP
jgi:integrase/recombinase XerD